MTRRAWAGFAFVVGLAWGQGSAEEAAVRGVVQKYVDARESRDERAVAGLFTEDADQLTSDGVWRRGREDVTKGSMASSQRTGGKRTITVETVRFPAAGVALADGLYELVGLAGGETRKMRTSFTMVKVGGAWKIAAIRNMLPAAAIPPSPGH